MDTKELGARESVMVVVEGPPCVIKTAFQSFLVASDPFLASSSSNRRQWHDAPSLFERTWLPQTPFSLTSSPLSETRHASGQDVSAPNHFCWIAFAVGTGWLSSKAQPLWKATQWVRSMQTHLPPLVPFQQEYSHLARSSLYRQRREDFARDSRPIHLKQHLRSACRR